MTLILILVSFVFATEKTNFLNDFGLRKRVCEAILDSGASDQIIPSGRDAKTIPLLKAALEETTQIAIDLGFVVPPHQLNFASSDQLSELVSVGGYAAPHELEGKKLLDGRKSLAGVLEFVTPGCPTCRAFYRDTTSVSNNISVIMHVLGHNLVAATSMYQVIRGGDSVIATLKLSHLMSDLYEKEDPDYVKYYYQLLLSMANMQDLAMGSYQSSESFKNIKDPDLKKGIRKPSSPTPSALQYYVANLPKDFPPWVHEMADLIEQIHRPLGYYYHTKILNEGVATFAQFLIARHSKYVTSNDIVELGTFVQNVAVPKIDNPYWLGLSGCWNMWNKFIKRADMQHLTPFERDREFVRQELLPMIEQWDNTKFIRKAFDSQWIFRHKLVLKREATIEDVAPGNYNYYGKEIFLSNFNNPRRILDHLARKLAYRPIQVPRVHLFDEHHLSGKEVLYKHEVFEDIPLARNSAAQTLFVFTQLWKKTVSLDTIASSAWYTSKQPPHRYYNSYYGPPPPPERLKTFPIRVTVDPTGHVQVIYLETGRPHEQLTKQMQGAIDFYKSDLDSSLNEDLNKEFKRRNKDAISAIVSAVVEPSTSVVSHSPTAAAAMIEYAKALETRLPRAIRRALESQQGIRTTATGVAIRVLPIIPEFALDFKVRKQMIEKLPPAPVDPLYAEFKSPHLNEDDASDLGSSDHQPGDLADKPKKEKGKGDPEDGDDEEAEPGDLEEPEDKPDQFDGKGRDPSEIEIPLEEWGKLIAQELELPNIRPIGTANMRMDRVRAGALQKDGDPIVIDKTAEEALSWGYARNRLLTGDRTTGRRGGFQEVRKLMRLGFQTMPPEEYFIRSHEAVPEPEMSAVIVFVMDLTGSMMGLPQKRAKELIYQIVSFMRAKYKKLEVRFVGYDDLAHEFFEPAIWKTFLGGGNTDSVGFIKALEILAESKYDNSNKYVYGTGDCGSSDTAPTIQALRSLSAVVQHMGFIENQTRGMWGSSEFAGAIRSLSQEIRWFDYTTLTQDQTSILKAMKDLYGKNKQR